jgi:predicted aldo/keto reductase-like oxidoreductase
MRSHMYAVGYGDRSRAARVMDGLEAGNVACARCDDCRVRCAQGFDVRDRAIRVASLVQGSHRTHA